MFSYTVVARGSVIVASYSPDGTDLTREVQKLLQTPFVKNEQRRMNRFVFTFQKKGNITFICATQNDEGTNLAIKYLTELSDKWVFSFGEKTKTAQADALSSQSRELFETVINDFAAANKKERIKREIEKTQRVITESIDMAMTRGDDLENLSSKTEDLLSTSNEFKNQATNLKNTLKCAHYKTIGVYFLLAIAVIYFVLTFVCGGLFLSKCFKK
jgi:vesicle-associated membrane protein 7